MAKEFKQNGGIITLKDFASYTSEIRDDNEIIYSTLSNGRMICGPPPPSSAAISQAILKIWITRSALGDVDFASDALQVARKITSDKWVDMIRLKITNQPWHNSCKCHRFTGNAVSVTSTINEYFGAVVMSESTGVVGTIRTRKKANVINCSTCYFNTQNNKEVFVVGAAGGSLINSAVAAAAFNHLWLKKI
uniref:Uncharacterized protein n=1 Tax=Ditylenchus dipsaci TaxID=166011 RepID=A0A915ENT5_9BILA